MIDRATVDRIIAAADIVEVLGDFITLKKKGTNYTACCPFHNEKTPSFMVSPAKGLYKCFGCGKGGGAVSFVMEHEKLSYPEALKWIAKKYGIPVEEKQLTEAEKERNNDRESMLVVNSWVDTWFQGQLNSTSEGQQVGLSYFKERGFTPQTIEKFGLGYCPSKGDLMSESGIAEGYKEKFLVGTGLTIMRDGGRTKYYDRYTGRVIFPIHSLTGRVIGFGGRTMSQDKKTAKYLNSPQSEIYDKSQTLYGIFHSKKAITQQDKCILVEGYTDVIQMHQSGVENVVASSGTSLTEPQVKLIKRFTKNVTVIYDGDSAGIKASLRGIDLILKEGLTVRVVPLPEGDDPDSFAKRHSAVELENYIEQHEEDFLQFKTRILLDDTKNDPAQRASVINDIVGSIAVIPDNITREVYIKECAVAMDISYDVLSRSVVTAMFSVGSGSGGGGGGQNSGGYYQPQQPSVVGTTAPSEPQTISTSGGGGGGRTSSIDALERELIGYLVKFSGEDFEFEVSEGNIVTLPVVGTIINELKNDQIEFTNPVYSQILSAFSLAHNAGREITTQELLSCEDSAIASTVADIVSWDDANPASQIWTKFDMRPLSEGELLHQSVPKAIVLYKSKVIEMRIKELQKQMAESDARNEIDPEVIDKIKGMNALKAEILDKFKRLL